MGNKSIFLYGSQRTTSIGPPLDIHGNRFININTNILYIKSSFNFFLSNSINL